MLTFAVLIELAVKQGEVKAFIIDKKADQVIFKPLILKRGFLVFLD